MSRMFASFTVFSLFALATSAVAQTIPAGPLGALQRQVNNLTTRVGTLEATVATLQSARPKLLALAAAGDTVLMPEGFQRDPVEFSDIPGMTVSFNTDNTSPICISATISGEFGSMSVFATVLSFFFLRVLLDGTLMQGHGLVTDLGLSFGFEGAGTLQFPKSFSSYTVWSCNVASGQHAVQVQWGTADSGQDALVRARTVVIQE